MAGATHYIHEGSALCSHAKEDANSSDSILEVTCGHCWKKYDDLQDRTVNVPEMRHAALQMKDKLDLAVKNYLDGGARKEPITKYGFWFLRGPDSVPDELMDEGDFSDVEGMDASYSKALRGATVSDLMEVSQKRLGTFGMWSKIYRENVDQLLRALQPILTHEEEVQRIRVGSDLRHMILARGGEQCGICDTTFSDSDSTPTIDHIIPQQLGGPSEEWNLRVLCKSCNAFKHVMIDPAGVMVAAGRLEEQIAV